MDEFDYWEVHFKTKTDLKSAYAHIAISAEIAPHGALVDGDQADEQHIREALEAAGLPFEIARSEMTKDEMWPAWPEDFGYEDEGDEDTPSP